MPVDAGITQRFDFDDQLVGIAKFELHQARSLTPLALLSRHAHGLIPEGQLPQRAPKDLPFTMMVKNVAGRLVRETTAFLREKALQRFFFLEAPPRINGQEDRALIVKVPVERLGGKASMLCDLVRVGAVIADRVEEMRSGFDQPVLGG